MNPVNRKYFAAVRNFSAVGLEMGVSVLIGVGIGYWVDSKWNTKPYGQICGIIFGLGAAALSVYKAFKLVKNTEDATPGQ